MNPIEDVLHQATRDRQVPGVVAAVGSAAGFRGVWNAGTADAAGTKLMAADAIFRIASMTKLVTAVAVMTLVDKGQLGLDDDVTSFLPEYRDLVVVEGFDTAGPRVRKPSRPAQRVDYGTGFDWAGLVVEAFTGQTFDVFCEQEIFTPLGMKMTSMRRPEERGGSLTPVLAVAGDGGFTNSGNDFPLAPEFYFGGGCLYTTAEDYLKFCMELAAPQAQRAGILTQASINEIFTNQSGALDIPVMRSEKPLESYDIDLGRGWKWGLGPALNPADVPQGRRAGSGGWGGIFNTFFWTTRRAGLRRASSCSSCRSLIRERSGVKLNVFKDRGAP